MCWSQSVFPLPTPPSIVAAQPRADLAAYLCSLRCRQEGQRAAAIARLLQDLYFVLDATLGSSRQSGQQCQCPPIATSDILILDGPLLVPWATSGRSVAVDSTALRARGDVWFVLGDRQNNTSDLRENCEHADRLKVPTRYGPYPHTDDGVARASDVSSISCVPSPWKIVKSISRASLMGMDKFPTSGLLIYDQASLNKESATGIKLPMNHQSG